MSWLVDGKRTHRNPCPPLVTNAPPALLRTVKKHTVTMGGMEDSRTEPCSNQGMGSVQNLVRNEACTTEEFPQKILPAINDACHPSARNVVCRGPVGVRSQQPSRLQMELVKPRVAVESSNRYESYCLAREPLIQESSLSGIARDPARGVFASERFWPNPHG